mmetsp:Transcript_24875/g.34731  ORF Transcript_24875/g.34731 Transcript_24875/m.34731 type:complete len:265 (+) Transcript_24875:333-1127(+)
MPSWNLAMSPKTSVSMRRLRTHPQRTRAKTTEEEREWQMTTSHMKVSSSSSSRRRSSLTAAPSLLSSIRNAIIIPTLRQNNGFRMDHLPKHLLFKITSFLEYKEVCQMSATCRYFSVAMCSVTIWRTLFARHFGVSVLRNAAALGGRTRLSVNWKERFRLFLADEAARSRHRPFPPRDFMIPPPPRGSLPVPIFPLIPGRYPPRPLFPFPYFIPPPPTAPPRPHLPSTPSPRMAWPPQGGVDTESGSSTNNNNGCDWFYLPPFM